MDIEKISEAQSEIEQRFEDYSKRMHDMAEQTAALIFQQFVKTFCRERKWRFLAGNGTWAFFPPNHRGVADPSDIDMDLDDPELSAMCDLLRVDIPDSRGEDLGSLMPDLKDPTYVSEEEKEDPYDPGFPNALAGGNR